MEGHRIVQDKNGGNKINNYSKLFEQMSLELEAPFRELGRKNARYNPKKWENLWPGAPARWVLRYLQIAIAASVDSTCIHRHTGATLVDIKKQQNGALAPFALGSCFNGAPTGIEPCTEKGVCQYRKLALRSFRKKHKLKSSMKELPEELRMEFKQFKEGYVKFCQAVHAEANAIYFSPVEVAGKLLFATTNPCPECAKMLVQKGIVGVIYAKPYKTDPTGKPLLAEETKRLFDEAKIPCINMPVPDWYWEWFKEEIMDSGEGIFDPLTDRKRD